MKPKKEIKRFVVSSPKFKPLYEKHRFKVLYGGRGSGKSYAMAQAAILYMINTHVLILSCRMYLNSIKDSNHALMCEMIEILGVEELFEITQNEIRCIKTNSKMIFKGLANNFTSIKSMAKIGICLVDEAESVTEEAWSVLIPTIREVGSEIWVSFNPKQRSDATWQIFVENPRPGTVLINVNIEDNPFVSQALLDEMEFDKANDPLKYDWIWRGLPKGSDDNVFISQIIIDEARERIPVCNPSLKVMAGLDVAGEGNDWTVLIRRRGNEILSIHKMQHGDTLAVTEWVKTIYAEHGWDEIIIDATGSTGVADHIDAWGTANRTFETTRWKASRSPRNPSKYKNARAESWGIMRDWLRLQGALTKDREWDDLAQVGFKYGEKDQIQLTSKSKIKKSPDFGDALALSLWYPDQEKETPAQTQRYTHHYGGTIT